MDKKLDNPLDKRSLAEWAADERERINKDWNVDGLPAEDRASRRRAVKAKVRERQRPLKKKYSTPEFEVPKKLWLHKFKNSEVLDRMLPARNGLWTVPWRRSSEVDQLQLADFSFLTNPEGTLGMIAALAQLEATSGAAQIDFDDDYCLDIAPYMVLSSFWADMLPIFERGGHMKVPIQKVLAAVGLGRALRMRFHGISDLDEIWAFPMQRRHKADTSSSLNRHLDVPKRERVADALHRELDKWLGVEGIDRELTDEGASLVLNMIGELLDNAERHSRPTTQDGDWQISAFMARRTGPKGNPRFKCYLGFLNVGCSFSETMAGASKSTRERLREYTRSAKAAGAKQSEGTLATLFALQDDVTSDDAAEIRGRGGFGMMSVLEFVSDIGRTDNPEHAPNVTVVSGNSCIHMKEKFGFGTKNERGLRELWFNETNDRSAPPDPNFVKDLRYNFPGTVVSISFTIDPIKLRDADANQSD